MFDANFNIKLILNVIVYATCILVVYEYIIIYVLID